LASHTRQRSTGRAPRPRRPGPPHSVASETLEEAVARSWASQSWSARLLRTFLGVTFVYAGLQKLADPGYLHAGSGTYIGTQLLGFARGSPIGGVLRALAHAPIPIGVFVALVEIGVGVGTLLGIAPVTAAAGGLAVNLILFLSASWHVHPYFLGSDSMYAVAWCAYLVALVETRRDRIPGPLPSRHGTGPADPGRRAVIRAGVAGAATLLLGGVAATVSRLRGSPPASLALPGGSPTGTPDAPGGRATPSPGRSTGAGSRSGHTHPGRIVARLASIPVGGAVGFAGPHDEPGVIVRLGQREVVAFSRVCTHAGCLVGYDRSARLLYCPCHGAEFDPSRGARPVAGPAPTPLPSIPVRLRPGSGDVVLSGE
jgi:thiosulfate dehydrogenase (quinone) large subunit